jgi:hypothetical protein
MEQLTTAAIETRISAKKSTDAGCTGEEERRPYR